MSCEVEGNVPSWYRSYCTRAELAYYLALAIENKSLAQVLAHIYFAPFFKLQLPLRSSFLTPCSLLLGLVWIRMLTDVPAVPFLWDSAKIQKFFQIPFSRCCNAAVRKIRMTPLAPIAALSMAQVKGPPAAVPWGATGFAQEGSARPNPASQACCLVGVHFIPQLPRECFGGGSCSLGWCDSSWEWFPGSVRDEGCFWLSTACKITALLKSLSPPLKEQAAG